MDHQKETSIPYIELAFLFLFFSLTAVKNFYKIVNRSLDFQRTFKADIVYKRHQRFGVLGIPEAPYGNIAEFAPFSLCNMPQMLVYPVGICSRI